MKMRIPAAVALFVGLCAVAPSALAQEKKGGKDWAYDFPDDKLLGIDGNGTTPMIKVRPPGRREMLHRPRLQFITEMLKSVENM